jgi:hypothetical protein
MQITPQDVRKVVTEEDDFAHEMQVAATLREFPAYQVSHGGTYTDSITGKPRQYDFRASLSKDDAEVFLSIESKNLSPRSPLVVCGRPRLENESFHDLIDSRVGTFKKKSVVFQGLSSTTLRAKGENSFYPPGQFTGKSLLRLKADKQPISSVSDTDVYDKWAQALSSLVDSIYAACRLAGELHKQHYYSAFLPLVVVPNATLWQCEYDLKGSVSSDPLLVDECMFFVGQQHRTGADAEKKRVTQHDFAISHIHFCTVRGLRSLLSRLAVDDQAWAQLLTRHAFEI